jgi:hypothetical protein
VALQQRVIAAAIRMMEAHADHRGAAHRRFRPKSVTTLAFSRVYREEPVSSTDLGDFS